jgi:hypothetical protein
MKRQPNSYQRGTSAFRISARGAGGGTTTHGGVWRRIRRLCSVMREAMVWMDRFSTRAISARGTRSANIRWKTVCSSVDHRFFNWLHLAVLDSKIAIERDDRARGSNVEPHRVFLFAREAHSDRNRLMAAKVLG